MVVVLVVLAVVVVVVVVVVVILVALVYSVLRERNKQKRCKIVSSKQQSYRVQYKCHFRSNTSTVINTHNHYSTRTFCPDLLSAHFGAKYISSILICICVNRNYSDHHHWSFVLLYPEYVPYPCSISVNFP